MNRQLTSNIIPVAVAVAVVVAVTVAGCSSSTPPAKPAPTAAAKPAPPPAAKPETKPTEPATITVTGVARDAKLGALLQGNKDHWIDGLDAWPEAMLNKKVKVTGKLEVRADLPVHVQPKPGEPQVSGIPVPEGADLNKASERLVISGAKWELAE